jgi:hypothetical protein
MTSTGAENNIEERLTEDLALIVTCFSVKRDLISVKRDLISVKRDLISGKRDLISGKRDLISGKRDLTCRGPCVYSHLL